MASARLAHPSAHFRVPGAPGFRAAVAALIAAVLLVAGAVTGCGGSGSAPKRSTSAVATPVAAPVQPTVAAPKGRPNIVFVLTDDLSSDLVRFMPHVLAMHRRGLSFSKYTVTDSLCCPSRASIFSGRYPHNTGIYTNGQGTGGFDLFHARGEEQSTFATALHAAGYRTAMMGKYLNGYLPRGSPEAPGPYVPPGWDEWDVAGNGYNEFNYRMNENGRVVSYGHRKVDYLTDVLSRKGTKFIRSSAASGRPFMLEIATFAPHGPAIPAPRDAHKFPRLTAPRTPGFDTLPINPPKWLAGRLPLTPRQLVRIDRAYRHRARIVLAVDRMIGRLERALRRAGVARNTYIVFSSDNGFHMGQHRLTPGKMTAYETDIRVPLVVTGPHVPAGRTSPALAENVDLAPTFEQLGGAAISPDIDGHSLVGLWHGGSAKGWRTAALVEHYGPDRDHQDPDFQEGQSGNPTSYKAIRTATTTYVEYADGDSEFYDLARDPEELDNLAPDLTADDRGRLHDALSALAGCTGGDACWAAGHTLP